MKKVFSILTDVFLAAVLLAGCATPGNITTTPGSPTSGATTSTTPPTTGGGQQLTSGTVEVRVMDAPRTDNVTSILVTVSRIEVHQAGSDNQTPPNSENETVVEDSDNGTHPQDGAWLNIPMSGNTTFDLMVLKETGLQQLLGSANLTTGKYTQIRMTIDKVEVKIGNDPLQTAKMPSGKIRFIHPFNVVAGQTTVLLFDFDADKFVNVTGSQIIVKPVIKLTTTEKTKNEKQNEALEITTNSLPSGKVGSLYDTKIEAKGGTKPYTWSISSGNLTPGLALNANSGVLSGNVTADGDFSFTVQVQDKSTPVQTDNQTLTIHIDP